MNTALQDSGCGQLEKACRVSGLGWHILSGYKWILRSLAVARPSGSSPDSRTGSLAAEEIPEQ